MLYFILGFIVSCIICYVIHRFYIFHISYNRSPFGNAWLKWDKSGKYLHRVEVLGRFDDRPCAIVRTELGEESIESLENIIFKLDEKVEVNKLVSGT